MGVKDHGALEGTAAVTTFAPPLSRPDHGPIGPVDVGAGTPRRDDALHLAHYSRMLQHLDHATDAPVDATIGRETQLVWHHLNVPATGIRRIQDAPQQDRGR